MKTLAAVLVETGKPLILGELDIPALKPGQVLVDVAFSGVCHTQILECRGYRGKDAFLPHCLGHEGSGTVLEIGKGVRKVKKSDRVLLSWMKGSGADVPGTVYQWNGKTVNAGAITTFMKTAVISENRLTVLPKSISLNEGAMLGCAVATGLGAVLNTAKAGKKNSLAVFGIGGIGLCAIAGAKIAGCRPIVGIDLNAERLKAAREAGATETIVASDGNTLERLKSIFPNGLDVAIEASGQPSVMRQALESVRNRGGSAVIIGNARNGAMLEIDPRQLNMGKRLLGTWGGDCDPDNDFPKFFRWLKSGKLPMGALTSRIYPLADVNQAIDDLESGKTLRPLIQMPGS